MPKKVPDSLPKKAKSDTDSAYIDKVFKSLYKGQNRRKLKAPKPPKAEDRG